MTIETTRQGSAYFLTTDVDIESYLVAYIEEAGDNPALTV